MKIGVLTYYGDLNFGTNLQAYATLQAVKNAYPSDEVGIIPLHTFWLRIIPYKSFSPISIWKDIVRILKYHKFKKYDLGVRGKDPHYHNHDEAIKYINSLEYDRIYIGADTLLELDRLKPEYDGISCYWLENVNAKKFVIAASAKNVQFEKLSSKQQANLKHAASQMCKIAVRDRSTYNLFTNLVDESCIEMLPDPTFSMAIDYAPIEKYLKKKHIVIPQKSVYINCFGYDQWLNPIVAELKDCGYTVVTSRPMGWSDMSLNDIGPMEQAGLLRYFDFVITQRFHEGVFCLKNMTPFLIFAGKGFTTSCGESKQVSLVKDFGLFPHAYLGAADKGIDVTNIIEKVKRVKDIFDREKIASVLQENADRYQDYVIRTVNS